MKIRVFRPDVSGYFSSNFRSKEKNRLEVLEQVQVIDNPRECPEILLSSSGTNLLEFDPQVLEKLRLIVHPNSGHDNLDENLLRKYHLPVILGNSLRAQAVSEYILSCLFHRYTSLPIQVSWDKKREWNRKLLREQKTLIFGFGHIGKILYKVLSPLIPNLSIIDPLYPSEALPFMDSSQLNYSNYDLFIFACNLTPNNSSFFNSKIFESIKPDATLINAARGGLVHWESLLSFLKDNPYAQAYIDVFPQEPAPIETWSEFRNLICTCHTAGVYKNLEQELIEFEYKILKLYLNQDQASLKSYPLLNGEYL